MHQCAILFNCMQLKRGLVNLILYLYGDNKILNILNINIVVNRIHIYFFMIKSCVFECKITSSQWRNVYIIINLGNDMFACLVVFNATFNNISVISSPSVLLVEETGEPGKNLSQVIDELYHIMLYTSPWSRFELKASVVIGTDYRGGSRISS